MKTRLVRIPSGVPLAVIREAIKLHEGKKNRSLPIKPSADEKKVVIDYIKKNFVDDEKLIEGRGDVVYNAVFDNIKIDAENDVENDAINDIAHRISVQLEKHLKAFKIDWTEVF
jgi:hypothetical protein